MKLKDWGYERRTGKQSISEKPSTANASSARNRNTPSSLHTAVVEGDLCKVGAQLEALMSSGADADHKNETGNLALRLAIATGPSSMVRLLLKYVDSFVNTQDGNARQALLDSAFSRWRHENSSEDGLCIMELLLQAGINFSNQSHRIQTAHLFFGKLFKKPRWYMLSQWEHSFFCSFLRQGVRLTDFPASEQRASCTGLVHRSIEDSVRGDISLEHEVLLHTPGSGLAEALVRNANHRVKGTLLSILWHLLHGCPDELFSASRPSRADLIKLLLQHGADSEETHSRERVRTPLTAALRLMPESEIVEVLRALLVVGGANPMRSDKDGEVPIFLAFRRFKRSRTLRLEVANLLLSHYKISVNEDTNWLMDYFPLGDDIHKLVGPEFLTRFALEVTRRLPEDVRHDFFETYVDISTRKAMTIEAEQWQIQGPPSYDNIRTILDLRESYQLPPLSIPQRYLLACFGSTCQLMPSAHFNFPSVSDFDSTSFLRAPELRMNDLTYPLTMEPSAQAASTPSMQTSTSFFF